VLPPCVRGITAADGPEPDQVLHDLHRLTPPERALFDDLRDQRLRPHLQLEQERVAFGWVMKALESVGGQAACSWSGPESGAVVGENRR
jgi:hypothetical protein